MHSVVVFVKVFKLVEHDSLWFALSSSTTRAILHFIPYFLCSHGKFFGFFHVINFFLFLLLSSALLLLLSFYLVLLAQNTLSVSNAGLMEHMRALVVPIRHSILSTGVFKLTHQFLAWKTPLSLIQSCSICLKCWISIWLLFLNWRWKTALVTPGFEWFWQVWGTFHHFWSFWSWSHRVSWFDRKSTSVSQSEFSEKLSQGRLARSRSFSSEWSLSVSHSFPCFLAATLYKFVHSEWSYPLCQQAQGSTGSRTQG